jgi:hypothetical protein
MAVLADILPNVGRSSRLALDLYKLAATVRDEAAEDLSRSAKAVNGFGSILKQLGTFIKEDDRIPSYEVCALHYLYMRIFHRQALTA